MVLSEEENAFDYTDSPRKFQALFLTFSHHFSSGHTGVLFRRNMIYDQGMKKALDAIFVLEQLNELYEPPKSFLDWDTPLDLLIATVLSAQCTDEVVNRVTKKLFKRVRTAQDYADIPLSELESIIRPCGTFRNKARFLSGIGKSLTEKFDGRVPDSMEELTSLPGVGRKTASIVLWAAFGKTEGIAVDTHVMRLAKRMGLSRKKQRDAIELDLMKKTPKKQWGEVNTLLISHGRAVCTARNPKCEKCVFAHTCPSSAVLSAEKKR